MAYTRVNWENYPSTNTPRNATNLNIMDEGLFNQDARITTNERNIATNTTNISNNSKYLSVTPNTNGDYKGNYGITLTANQIYHIYFNGNATDATKNARVSLDNGANYKNIKSKSGKSINTFLIQNSIVSLYFNGTDFINLNEIKKTIWNNPNPANPFSPQTITLLDAIEHYDKWKILIDDFIPYKNYAYLDTPIPIPYAITHCFSFNDGNGLITRNRAFNAISTGTSLTIANGYQGGTIDNAKCVPLTIYGIIE